jgi:hypothetical protein
LINSKCNYTYGLDRIYTRQEIEKAKASPSFESEYNLKYLGLIGNVFHNKDIEAAIQKGTGYSPSEIIDYSLAEIAQKTGLHFRTVFREIPNLEMNRLIYHSRKIGYPELEHICHTQGFC